VDVLVDGLAGLQHHRPRVFEDEVRVLPGDPDFEVEQPLDELARGKIELHPPPVHRHNRVVGDLEEQGVGR
jgi:hypothetical protein